MAGVFIPWLLATVERLFQPSNILAFEYSYSSPRPRESSTQHSWVIHDSRLSFAWAVLCMYLLDFLRVHTCVYNKISEICTLHGKEETPSSCSHALLWLQNYTLEKKILGRSLILMLYVCIKTMQTYLSFTYMYMYLQCNSYTELYGPCKEPCTVCVKQNFPLTSRSMVCPFSFNPRSIFVSFQVRFIDHSNRHLPVC